MTSRNEIEMRAALLCRVMAEVNSASVALAWWVDEGPLTIEVLSSRVRQMLAGEYAALDGRRRTDAVERHGLLRTPAGGTVVALTTALVLPHRLPRVVRLDTGIFDPDDDREEPRATRVPLGESLSAHYCDVRRVDATARTIFGNCDASGAPLAVRCEAVLTVDGRPAALVREDVTMAMLEEFEPAAEVVETFPVPPVDPVSRTAAEARAVRSATGRGVGECVVGVSCPVSAGIVAGRACD